MLEKMHGTSFDFSIWRNGSIIDLGLKMRQDIIVSNKDVIKKYAIGFCPGEEVMCRPKADTMAVMFLKDNKFFWTHLKQDEFNKVLTREVER